MNEMSDKVCMVVYSYYPRDQRVRKEAEALQRNGFDVSVICLRQKDESKDETVRGVRVHRLALQTAREGNALRYAYQYLLFFLLATAVLTSLHLKERFRVVHLHSLPDFIVFAAFLPKMLGAKIVLDLHEGMPEIYVGKMKAKPNGAVYNIIAFIEKVSASYADEVITVSDLIKELMVGRGLDGTKLDVIYNVPDFEGFVKHRKSVNNKLVYAGTLNEFQDFDTVISALAKMPDIELDIYGDGSLSTDIKLKVAEEKLEHVVFHGWISPIELRSVLPSYAGAIIPFVDNEITRIALGHKALESSMLGLAVVAVDLPGLRRMFDDSCFYYYRANDPESLWKAIAALLSDEGKAAMKVDNSQKAMIEKGLTWSKVEEKLVRIYRDLLRNTDVG